MNPSILEACPEDYSRSVSARFVQSIVKARLRKNETWRRSRGLASPSNLRAHLISVPDISLDSLFTRDPPSPPYQTSYDEVSAAQRRGSWRELVNALSTPCPSAEKKKIRIPWAPSLRKSTATRPQKSLFRHSQYYARLGLLSNT